MKSVMSPSTRSFSIAFAALTCSLVMFGYGDAFAQATDFAGAQTSIVENITKVPPAIAVFCYVIGVYFAADGLLKMKAWIEDSERNTINAAIFRLVVSALLIYLPHGFILVNNTILGTGSSSGEVPKTPPPKLKVFH